jgi:hypothetical protein
MSEANGYHELTPRLSSIIGLATPDMLDTITYGTYIFFAAFCLLALAFTFFCIPETRGKVRRPVPISFLFVQRCNRGLAEANLRVRSTDS